MSQTILSQDRENTNPFDTYIPVDVRAAGGTVALDTEHMDWLGRDLIRFEMPLGILHLAPHEARDLASALLNLAAHLDEEQPREICRNTEPGAPAFEEAI